MGLKSDDGSKTIVTKLLILTPAFYTLYYVVSIILTAALDNSWKNLGDVPFEFDHGYFSPANGNQALGPFLAMIISYTLGSGLVFFIVRNTRKAWDYVVTLSLLHFCISCAVNQAFPTNWIWWLTFILCTAWTIVLSSVSHYYLRDMRDIQLAR